MKITQKDKKLLNDFFTSVEWRQLIKIKTESKVIKTTFHPTDNLIIVYTKKCNVEFPLDEVLNNLKNTYH